MVDEGRLGDAVAALDVTVELPTGSMRFRCTAGALAAPLARWLRAFAEGHRPPAVVYDLYADMAGGGEVSRDGARCYAGTVAEVLDYLELDVVNAALSLGRDRWPLHAAGLVRDGQALVLAGASGAGKSTAVASLLRAGWRYLSDDLVFIDQHAGVTGLARPMTFDALPQVDLPADAVVEPPRVTNGARGWRVVLPASCRWDGGAELRALAAWQFDGGGPTRLARLTDAEALTALWPSTQLPSARSLGIASRILQRTGAFAVRVSCEADVVAVAEELALGRLDRLDGGP